MIRMKTLPLAGCIEQTRDIEGSIFGQRPIMFFLPAGIRARELRSGILIEYQFILGTTAQPFRHHGNLIRRE
jgi:hypothetical protein